MIVKMLQNFDHRYSNHNSNIKYIGFETIHYAINFDVVLCSIIFSNFDYMFFFNIFIV